MCRTHNRKKYIVRLSATERRDLTKLTSTGKAAAHRITASDAANCYRHAGYATN